jgi:SAM-dependent methyltransferase
MGTSAIEESIQWSETPPFSVRILCMKSASRIAVAVMRWGSTHRRFRSQDCYTDAFARPREGNIGIATQREFEDGDGFFRSFGGGFKLQDIAGKNVLDLGCGHGGRMAYYVVHGNPASISGIEISISRVRIAARSVRGITEGPRIHFAVGTGESIPFQTDSFDIIISYDVFEHVQDLPRVLLECCRVLRPGGRLYALFPPYYGPRAHHLDFVTTLPFLHYIFSPDTLATAANRILEENPGLRDEPLPVPSPSYLGRQVLPRLSGTTVKDFGRILKQTPFEQVSIELVPFASSPGGLTKRLVRSFCGAMLRIPWPFPQDVFVGTIRCILEKQK